MQKRLTDPRSKRQRMLALTPELVALTHPADRGSRVRRRASPISRRRNTGRSSPRRLPARRGGAMWLFAFGSLIWKPGCAHRGGAEGAGARLASRLPPRLGLPLARQPEHPNLMMGLDRGGQCARHSLPAAARRGGEEPRRAHSPRDADQAAGRACRSRRRRAG